MAKEQLASEFVAEFAEGDLDRELTEWIANLTELIRVEAMNRGKEALVKGEINMKLRFCGECHGGRDVLINLDYELTKKEPKPARSGELFFVKGKSLVREQPRQERLAFEAELDRAQKAGN